MGRSCDVNSGSLDGNLQVASAQGASLEESVCALSNHVRDPGSRARHPCTTLSKDLLACDVALFMGSERTVHVDFYLLGSRRVGIGARKARRR